MAIKGSAALRKEESSPTNNSRLISNPTSKKKMVINPSLMNSIIRLILSAMRKQIKITDLQMKFMQKELLINRSNRRIGYDSSRYCRYKQKDTRRNIH